MIVVQMRGGLGNQLFQYAAGWSLAEKLGTKIRISVKLKQHGLKVPGKSEKKLQILDLALPAKKLNHLVLDKVWREASRFSLDTGISSALFRIYKEKSFQYEEKFFQLKNNFYLEGYFQSEKYFENIRDKVSGAFKPGAAELRHRIETFIASKRQRNRELVSIHVRRGDYLHPELTSLLTDDQFYEQAIAQFPKAHFLVFSDDIPWCKKKFSQSYKFSFSPFDDPVEDLYAMTLCHHNIIAKSTFSWWGAYLNFHVHKRIIAPKIIQSKNPKFGCENFDYYPENYTIL